MGSLLIFRKSPERDFDSDIGEQLKKSFEGIAEGTRLRILGEVHDDFRVGPLTTAAFREGGGGGL